MIGYGGIFSQLISAEPEDFFDEVYNSVTDNINHEQLIFNSPLFQESVENGISKSTINHEQLIFVEDITQETVVNSISSSISHAIP